MNKGRGLSKSYLLMLTPEMFAQAQDAAAAEGKSMAQWVREAMAAKLGNSKPWVNDIEVRADGDVVKEIHEAMQRWHNRGGK